MYKNSAKLLKICDRTLCFNPLFVTHVHTSQKTFCPVRRFKEYVPDLPMPLFCAPICNKMLPKNTSLIFRKLGARKARILRFVYGLAALAHRERLCSFPKAPFLHSQRGTFGLSEHSIWYTKSIAFRVQERCFGNARIVLLFNKNYTLLIYNNLC